MTSQTQSVLPLDEGHVVDLGLTLAAWSPPRGRLRRIAPEPACERDFHGWTGLASALSALAADILPASDGSAGEDQS